MKSCSKCKTLKIVEDFPKDKTFTGGRSVWCKRCKANATNRWYYSHLDQARESNKKWAYLNIDKVKTYKRKYYEKNKELVKKKATAWIKCNPDKVKEIQRNYYKNNPEKSTFYHKKRVRAKRANGSHTFQEWLEMKKRHSYRCWGCKRIEPEIKLEEDHIVPLNKHGSDHINNIQPLCRSCNSHKNDKFIHEVWFKVLEERMVS